MTVLHRGTRTMPAAGVGLTNPLPPLLTGWDIHQIEDTSQVDAEMAAGASYGRVASVLPYQPQDGYDRNRTTTDVDVIVLENDRVRAEFLLGMGGRLWSLQVDGRELLHANPVLQPAHFALRNAWVAGGVEWNIGTIGHTMLTAEPLHTVVVDTPQGPMLRMYEYERMRGVVYRIEARLPADSPVLLVGVTIENPNDHDVAMYWWSNIAVQQRADVRVLAPAQSAWTFGYDDGLSKVAIPGDPDASYPSRAPHAADYFFDVTTPDRPWIAALGADGTGLAQTSTPQLRGRKLFVWGSNVGGRRWQEWLSGPGGEYLEIQAGLARTQLEHVRMPAGARWSWVEAYGLAQAEPGRVHGEWDDAVAAGADAVTVMLDGIDLDAERALFDAWADLAPTAVLEAGSGWGALQAALTGANVLDAPGTPFPRTADLATAPWWALLEGSEDWGGDIAIPPVSYQIDPRWDQLLAASGGWQAALHRGILALAAGDREAARGHWEASLGQADNPWAWRGLAALATHAGDRAGAAEAYCRAHALAPDMIPLLRETLEALLDAGAAAEAQALLEAQPEAVRAKDRFRLAQARVCVQLGDLDAAKALIDTLEVADIREGEPSLEALWADYQAALGSQAPLPEHFDFRMRVV